jgi:hypothetical protein
VSRIGEVGRGIRKGIKVGAMLAAALLLTHSHSEGVLTREWEMADGATKLGQEEAEDNTRHKSTGRRKPGRMGRSGETAMEVMVGTSEQEPD